MTDIVAQPKTDIAALFALDPLQLTDENIDEIIRQFRNNRHAFNAGNRSAGSTKPKTAKQKAVEDLSAKIDLGSLGL